MSIKVLMKRNHEDLLYCWTMTLYYHTPNLFFVILILANVDCAHYSMQSICVILGKKLVKHLFLILIIK